jgi:signal transduction histidine kinase
MRRYGNRLQIEGYSGELRQLLSNLVVNAVDAMPENGVLQVRVAPSHKWSESKQGVRMTVADNGSGILPSDLAHIFEPFYTTKKDSGTGLGLWVSRGIIEKHGGSIRVRSRSSGPKTGTVFFIFLPHQLQVGFSGSTPLSPFSDSNLQSAKVQ